MGALGAVGARTEILPNSGVKIISVYTDDVPHAADTLTVDLSKYGCSNIHGIYGGRESTTGSIVVIDQPTTMTVSSSLLTITVPAGANDKVRCYLIFAY